MDRCQVQGHWSWLAVTILTGMKTCEEHLCHSIWLSETVDPEELQFLQESRAGRRQKAAASKRDASDQPAGETGAETVMGQGWARAAWLYILLFLYLSLNVMPGPLDACGELPLDFFALIGPLRMGSKA